MIKSIIVADDSATARMVTIRCIEIAGFNDAEFFEAQDGYEALDLVKGHPIDLLITDLNMPHMDGKTLLKRIKESSNHHDLPVMIISSSKNQAKEEELYKLGAYAVLGKPISPASVSEALQSLSNLSGWGN